MKHTYYVNKGVELMKEKITSLLLASLLVIGVGSLSLSQVKTTASADKPDPWSIIETATADKPDPWGRCSISENL